MSSSDKPFCPEEADAELRAIIQKNQEAFKMRMKVEEERRRRLCINNFCPNEGGRGEEAEAELRAIIQKNQEEFKMRFTNPHGKREANSALEKIATLANMYSEEELRNETDEERPMRDAAALAIIDEILELNASAASAARLQEKEKEQARIRLMMQEQEQKKILERHRNPHKVESKKYWRWEQYGDDSDRDCKTCGERVGFASWAHCSDRCLIDDVGFETYQEAMKSGDGDMRKLRIRPGWKSEFEKEV